MKKQGKLLGSLSSLENEEARKKTPWLPFLLRR
jgi:hypothetical protein